MFSGQFVFNKPWSFPEILNILTFWWFWAQFFKDICQNYIVLTFPWVSCYIWFFFVVKAVGLGALKGTELRWQREPKTQIFAENRRFSQIHPFSWKFQHLGGRRKPQKTADFRRKPKIFAENRRKPQFGLRHLRCVTFSLGPSWPLGDCSGCNLLHEKVAKSLLWLWASPGSPRLFQKGFFLSLREKEVSGKEKSVDRKRGQRQGATSKNVKNRQKALCRQSRRTKKTKNNPFFHLKISEFCVLNVPTKSAVGWNCIEPEATSLTMQGFMSLPRRFSCPIAVVAIAWNNCANTQRLGVAEKSWRPVRDFLREKFAKKNAFLSAEIWVWKREKKSQTIFSNFWSWSVCRVSFSKSHTRRHFFSAWQQSLLSWLCSQHVTPACSTKCALWKSSKTLQRVLVVPAWQGALHENNREKIEKKSHDEVLHRTWRKKRQKYFRHFSTFFAQAKNVKNRQKVSKIFSTFFDNFRAAPVFRPVLGGSGKNTWRKQICGIVPGLGGCQNFVYVFFGGHSLWGRKTHKRSPPQIPGTIPWNFCLCVFLYVFFFRSQVLVPRNEPEKGNLRKLHRNNLKVWVRNHYCRVPLMVMGSPKMALQQAFRGTLK